MVGVILASHAWLSGPLVGPVGELGGWWVVAGLVTVCGGGWGRGVGSAVGGAGGVLLGVEWG